MKAKKLVLKLCILAIVTSTIGCYHPIKKYLVNLENYPDLVITDWNILKSEEEIRNYLGDKYTLYSAYNIRKIIFQEITTPNYQKIIIEIFYTKHKMDAINLYNRYRSINQIGVGEIGSESAGFIAFYRNKAFVKIHVKGHLRDDNKIIRELARQIDIKLMRK